ncbi:tail fiber protein [Sphingomonas paucimobilis]|uniref:phage tail protein n=1 Tax=Sphingomonas paucimobilis TaxID=13689 RepID=UPI0028D77DB6|nr:tail fiber protein [Sphingomonas paucimobilis]
MEAYIGYVMFTAGSYAPYGWSLCQGQILNVSQYNAVFALLGVTYGGNGSTTFGLPHLGGRVPVGTGQAPGVSHNYQAGETAGTEQTTILTTQMPAHVHAFPAQPGMAVVTDNTGDDSSATASAGARLGNLIDPNATGAAIYVPAGVGTTTVNLAGTPAGTTGIAGGNQPMSIMQPYLAMNAAICLQGIYPPRD